MTLALAILLAVSWNVLGGSSPLFGRQEQSATQQALTNPSGESGDKGGKAQNNPPSNATPSASTSAQGSSAQPKTATKKRRHKKRVVPANCETNATATGSSAPTPGSQTAAQSGTSAGATPQSSQSNCPPSKIVVRHGGTSEPSIQLAGDQPPKERDVTNQLLSATDANLRKLEGRQLSANQQDMVSQVRQFMEQSRSAMGAGDFQRSRTLAWKAQLLSEELTNPPK